MNAPPPANPLPNSSADQLLIPGDASRALWANLALIAIAGLTWLLVVARIDATGRYPALTPGPGLTIDESLNVNQAVYLAEVTRVYGVSILLLVPEAIREAFGPESLYLADYPPLGRLWLGVHHHAVRAFFPPADFGSNPAGSVVVITAARIGSATAFALNVWLIGWCVRRWYGAVAGVGAAICLALMPRAFGHAHLASIETILNLTWSLAVLSVASWATNSRLPRWWEAGLAGVCLGLALLTKIQAVFLGPIVIFWVLMNWRWRGLVPLLIWGLVGWSVFFLAWPWLWLDPWDHLRQYLGSTTKRVVIHSYYLGVRYEDKQVPWHAPWLIFAVTIPLMTHALALWGGWRTVVERQRVEPGVPQRTVLAAISSYWMTPLGLATWAVGCTLLLFSLPGVPLYDGERLFLVVCPMWAMLAGVGLDWCWRRAVSLRSRWMLTGGLIVGLGGPVLTCAPCYLSYYNLLVGGLPGAAAIGLELNYWGDAVTMELLEAIPQHVPPRSKLAVFPVLHPVQLPVQLGESPLLTRHQLELVPYVAAERPEYLLLFQRREAIPSDWPGSVPANAEAVVEVRRQGVVLAGLYRLSK